MQTGLKRIGLGVSKCKEEKKQCYLLGGVEIKLVVCVFLSPNSKIAILEFYFQQQYFWESISYDTSPIVSRIIRELVTWGKDN